MLRTILRRNQAGSGELNGLSAQQTVGAFLISAGKEIGSRVLQEMSWEEKGAVTQGIVQTEEVGHQTGMHALEMVRQRIAAGDFVEIGKDTQKGVVATVKVKTYDDKTMETMAKMGMNATHHVMVFFTDEKSGAAVASGKAALKIKGVDAKPVMMMQMGTGFGGDITVAEGMATFEIGTKLEDGKKRQFSIMFHNM